MKNILIPVDNSACSDNAVLYGISIAKSMNAKITLLHVEDNDVINSSSDGTGTIESVPLLRSYETQLAHAGGISYLGIAETGSLHTTILREAKKLKTDLIVMGTHRETDLATGILGSNTGAVIADAECPVLAVPAGSSFHLPKHITFATDYHNADVSALKYVLDLFGNERAQINFLHIANSNEDAGSEVKKMEAFMKNVEDHVSYNNMSFQMMKADDQEKQLQEYINNRSTDLLVMTTRHKGSWRKLFDPGMTRNIAEVTGIPLLAFHHKKESSVKLI